MISIARLAANADTAIYYVEAIANDRDDYYVASGEVPVRCLGRGSALLGLNSDVTPEDLRAILDGLDPLTGEPPFGYRRNSGFDLTLSAPKSVSRLWRLGDRATAEQVVAAHDQAVLVALAYLEDAAYTVRRGKAGSTHHRAGGLVVAAFRHRTSREADPQSIPTSPPPTWRSVPTDGGRRCTRRTSGTTPARPASPSSRSSATRSPSG